MKHFQPGSFSKRARARFYVLIFFVGGLIRNTSLSMLILCFGLTLAAPAADVAKAFWHHPGVRSFVTALEAELADTGASAADLAAQPPLHFKDPAKAQKDENRDRRRLAAELRQGKASAGHSKAGRQHGPGI
jgi:hypothetical protein